MTRRISTQLAFNQARGQWLRFCPSRPASSLSFQYKSLSDSVGSTKRRFETHQLFSRPQIAPLGASKEGTLKIHTKGRKLDSSGSASYFFLWPIVAWGALTVTMYGLSCWLVSGADAGLRDIEAAGVASALATRVRFFATQLVLAASIGAEPTEVASLRLQLRAEADKLLRQHDAIVYGNAEIGLPGALYASEERNAVLYGEGCLRSKGACRAKSDPFYTATNYGLENMVRAFADRAQLLSADSLPNLVVSNEYFAFIWDVRLPGATRLGTRIALSVPVRLDHMRLQCTPLYSLALSAPSSPLTCPQVGLTDLTDALEISEELFLTEATEPIQTAVILQTAIFPILIAGKLAFLLKLFRPWLQRTMHETKHVAELLSQLPKELNVSSLIIESMDKDKKPGDTTETGHTGGGRKPVPRSKKPGQGGSRRGGRG